MILPIALALYASHAQDPRQTAVAAVVQAWRTRPVVAIAEAHGLAQAGEFYLAVIRDSAFQAAHPDIVIEFASRQSQPLLDRYVMRGDSVPPDSLATIWRNTTKVASWDSPIYARWLAAIRDVNRTLPPARRLRVLAGDTPVDWDALRTRGDWARLSDNNQSFASVIEDEVLARGRRAFVVLGSNHLMKTGDRDGGPNTATRIEEQYPGSMYVIWLYTGRPGGTEASARIADEGWTAPSVHPLAGSWLGDVPVGGHPFSQAADAVLFLGPPDSLEVVAAPLEGLDLEYRRELEHRSWIEWGDSSRARRFLKFPAPSAHGSVAEFQVPLPHPDHARQVWVYTPAGYPEACPAGCDLLVAFDGGEYVTSMRVPEILDSLIAAHRIPPTVALFIENGSGPTRLGDLANHVHFVNVVADQVLPWVRARWRVTRDAKRTVITGSSAGGLAAAYLAFARPKAFGNVLSQSGAFWRGDEGSNSAPFEWLATQYQRAPRRGPIRFLLDVGSTERSGALGGTAPSILEANRTLHSVLTSKGYEVEYTEVPDGTHDPATWRVRLPIDLVALMGLPAAN